MAAEPTASPPLTRKADEAERPGRLRLLKILGPGLVTGAADDDPSGIGTYSQAGAQLGFSISWTMLLTFPLMVAIQEISARVGRTTGKGIASNIRAHYPAWLLYVLVALLFGANVINIGADLAAMADALKLLIGGPGLAYVVALGFVCALAQILMDYEHYSRILKWACLVLFFYVAALLAVKVPWGAALKGLFVPTIDWTPNYFTTLVAIAGTTISPYLFFWQASQEAEEVHATPERQPLIRLRWQAPGALARIRADTVVGMGFSNLIAIAIMLMTAATLHANGVANVQSSEQAAKALQPIAGPFAYLIFTIGIIGTGLLAVPVLAGSSAYGVAEAAGWPVGLARRPREASAFYGILSLAMLIGVGINFAPINPISALYWSAVVNGVVALPIMVLLMLMTAQRRIMGDFTIGAGLKILGWGATIAMLCAVAGMVATAAMGSP
ncbi:MAG TPA: divalent metal cation transporter [Stellaceae bacterium]|jgi:NRAMP (natural resistance-associated macrophage protein)-like metal ion transporter|nr:divalent metal cation transporter [Stellaceae bacterium]